MIEENENLVRVSGEFELSEFELSRFYCITSSKSGKSRREKDRAQKWLKLKYYIYDV